MPVSVDPRLHPRVVIVTMRPTRYIDDPRGNAHGAQRRDQQHGFLAAAPEGATHDRQRIGCALVRGLIGCLFVAPVVHLQRRRKHVLARKPRRQLPIERLLIEYQILVVDAGKEHVGQKKPFRNGAPPRRLRAHSKRVPHDAHKRRVALRDLIGDGQRPAQKSEHIFLLEISIVHTDAP